MSNNNANNYAYSICELTVTLYHYSIFIQKDLVHLSYATNNWCTLQQSLRFITHSIYNLYVGRHLCCKEL